MASGMTSFGASVSVMSVCEQYILNIEVHTWLGSHGLIV